MSDQYGNTEPGWYYAEGDPPGTQRFWDGAQWQGGPQVVGSTAANPANPYTGGQIQALGGQYEGSQSVTALVLAILGFFCCGIPGTIGWYLAHQETQAIDLGRRNPAQRGTATAAKVIGIIATLMWGGLYLLWFVGAAAGF